MPKLLYCNDLLASRMRCVFVSSVSIGVRVASRLLVLMICCCGAGRCLAPGLVAGATIYSGNHFDFELTALGDVGLTPLKAFELTVMGKAGATPNAFDSTKGGFPGLFPGITTIGNALHQVWEFDGVVMTPTLDLAGDSVPFPEQLDSHFLVDASPDGNVHPFNPPDEDAVLGSVEDPRGGFGTYLEGTFFLRAGYGSSAWDLAYVVVPADTQLRFDFEVAGKLGEFDEVLTTFHVRLGDMNVDGEVDFDDILPFVLAVQDPLQYAAIHGVAAAVFGDLNSDSLLDFDDIPLFINLLDNTQSSPPLTAPELPAGKLLLSAAIVSYLGRRRRRPKAGRKPAIANTSPVAHASATSQPAEGSGTP